ncbi:MAG: flagellar biosynthetic protein FliQ [Planctomycetota bacterium]|nr:MAG: flagellar biosynthetic protein FliQ [Planctomycetota bacterium]
MDMTTAIDTGREALLTALIIAAPILGTGIVIGLLVSLFQTLTQLQDQTFSIVPKIVAMIGAAVFFVPWLAARLLEYSQQMFSGQ